MTSPVPTITDAEIEQTLALVNSLTSTVHPLPPHLAMTALLATYQALALSQPTLAWSALHNLGQVASNILREMLVPGQGCGPLH